MLNRPPLMGNYHIMDRINFIKDMIQTHQNHLKKFDSEPSVIQQPKFKPSFQFEQIYKSSGSDAGKRTEQSRSFTLQSEPSNISFYDSFELSKPKSSANLKKKKTKLKQQSLNMSSDFTLNSHEEFFTHKQPTKTERLKIEELRVMRESLTNKTKENQMLITSLREKDNKIKLLEDQIQSLELDVKKITREKDDFSDQMVYLKKKNTQVEEEHEKIKLKEAEIKKDLEDARQSVLILKNFELELQQREKAILQDWQAIEKDRISIRDKQQQLINAERQLQDQVQAISELKQRIERQEKKLEEKFQIKTEQLNERSRLLDDQERQIRIREVQVTLKLDEQVQLEQQLMSMQLNEDLWKKKIQSEMKTIEQLKHNLVRR